MADPDTLNNQETRRPHERACFEWKLLSIRGGQAALEQIDVSDGSLRSRTEPIRGTDLTIGEFVRGRDPITRAATLIKKNRCGVRRRASPVHARLMFQPGSYKR